MDNWSKAVLVLIAVLTLLIAWKEIPSGAW